MPDDKDGKFYHWLFKFANTFAANVTRAVKSKFPDASSSTQSGFARFELMPGLIIMVGLFGMMIGCSEPPDQIARDVIAAGSGAIKTAQAQYHDQCVANPNQDSCAEINKAIDALHLAKDSLSIYCSFAPNSPADAKCQPLKAALPGLQAAISNLNNITNDVNKLVKQ